MRRIFYILSSILALFLLGTSSAISSYYLSGKSYFPNQTDYYKIESSVNGEWSFILNETKTYDGGQGIIQITLSEDTAFHTFIKKEKDTYYRVVTSYGEDENAYEKIKYLTVLEKEYLYVGNDGGADIVILNGKVIEKFDEVTKVAFSKGNILVTGIHEGKIFIHNSGTGFLETFEGAAGIYSSDSYSRNLIPIKKDNKWYLSEDGNLINTSGFDLIVNVKFSSDEKTFFYTVKEGRYRLIVNEAGKTIGEKYDYIPQFEVSDDGEKVAYTYYDEVNKITLLNVDNNVIEKQTKININGWSSEGRIAYTITDTDGKTKYTEQ